ncbi:MAG: hypothetical protein MK085_10315 [Phycisphaerales bacterium]|nr:hypothetical protein [Phycisphaerales bacterium]
MVNVDNGQCGTCAHFGTDIPEQQLVQIRIDLQADPETVGGCGHPTNVDLHLKVSVNSSCDGYVAAA